MNTSLLVLYFISGFLAGAVAYHVVRRAISKWTWSAARICSIGTCTDSKCPWLHFTYEIDSPAWQHGRRAVGLPAEESFKVQALPRVMNVLRKLVEAEGISRSLNVPLHLSRVEKKPEVCEDDCIFTIKIGDAQWEVYRCVADATLVLTQTADGSYIFGVLDGELDEQEVRDTILQR